MTTKNRCILCLAFGIVFVFGLLFLNFNKAYADVIYSENGEIKEVDTSFSGVGSEYITFRTYMVFNVYNEYTGKLIKQIPFENSVPDSDKIQGTYFLNLNGTKIATYINTGDNSKLYFEENYDSKIKNYLESDPDTNYIRNVSVKFIPLVKIYSRKNFVGPYNYDSDGNNYWDGLSDCTDSGWAVYVDTGKGKDAYGTPLSGFYSLNQTQINNITEIFEHGKYLKFTYALDVNLSVIYECNGGKITVSDVDGINLTVSNCTFTQKSSLGDMYVINEIPERNNHFFWYWSTEEFSVNEAPIDTGQYISNISSDVFFYEAGDTVEFFNENQITLFACWGTSPIDDLDKDSSHIHKYKKNKQKYGKCEICKGTIYCYVYLCSVCNEYMEGDPEIIDHTCIESTLGILNGSCTVCDEKSEDYIGIWIKGQEIVLAEPADYEVKREGHKFLYYAENYDGSGERFYPGDVYKFDNFGEVETIYAIYEPLELTLTFDFNKESALYAVITGENITVTVSYDDFCDDMPTPEIDKGYVFEGWYSESKGEMLTSGDRYGISQNEILKAQYTPCEYTVYLDINAPENAKNLVNTGIDSGKAGLYNAKYGTKFENIIPFFAVPVADNYELKGWYVSGEKDYLNSDDIFLYTDDIIVKGEWKIKTCSVTLDPGEDAYIYNLNSGEDAYIFDLNPGEKYTLTIPYGTILSGEYLLPAASRKGFDFLNWNTRDNGYGEDVQNGTKFLITEDVTLYPKWQGKKYKITFDYSEKWKYDAEELKNADMKYLCVTYGERVTGLPTPKRKGYTFLGWSIKNVVYDNKSNGDKDAPYVTETMKYEFLSDITLYAVWEALTVYVNYDFNYDYTIEIPLKDSE